MCAPTGTSAPILDNLHADLSRVLIKPGVKQRFADMVVDAAPQSRVEFAAFIRSEMQRWAKVVIEAGIPVQ